MKNNGTRCDCAARNLESTGDEHHYRCKSCGQTWMTQIIDGMELVAVPPRPDICPSCSKPVAADGKETRCEHCESYLRFYVNEYLENQRYGGPEEGGWWYDVGEYERCHGCFSTRAAAETRQESLKKYLAEARRTQTSTGNVNCAGYTSIYIDGEKGEDFPNERPRYE